LLFVTQVPIAGYATLTSSFANHRGHIEPSPRGGDLMLRYPDGELRNLTREAGFGMVGQQGANAIAVREPAVHWNGNRALFSMVVGAPVEQFEERQYYWQLYEVSGLARGERAVIRKIPGQPESYNNVAPAYGSDDRILFASDRPRGGERHLYPQLDEYEGVPTTTGLWSLDRETGDLRLLNHSPSGVFSPLVDSAGRIVFTKWDHLKRDQNATNPAYDAITFADESEGATSASTRGTAEFFPEPENPSAPDHDPRIRDHDFNQFFPWEMNEDGSEEETLNHVGRHELGGAYGSGTFLDDENLLYLFSQESIANRYFMSGDGGLFHLREEPGAPGNFLATYAHEFDAATTGQIVRLEGRAGMNPESMRLLPLTALDFESAAAQDRFRNPVPMSDGTLVAVHLNGVPRLENKGTLERPRYDASPRLAALRAEGGTYVLAGNLTAGINARVTWYNPYALITFDGTLWELDPVEVAPRVRPARRTTPIPAPEVAAFASAGVEIRRMRAWLQERELAMIVSRNVTRRDRADFQQPFNLRVPQGVETRVSAGRIYDVSRLQVFQADAIRAYRGVPDVGGRRLLARPMHGPEVSVFAGSTPAGSVGIASDGSFAAIVPALRALSWQLTDAAGTAVVRERNWVSLQPGEIRSCPACHGINTTDHLGRPPPENVPEALKALLLDWKARYP
jgi:hypothetical protein